jgi:hypothetical protein
MLKEDKIKILEENGWYQWYSSTHYVHPNIFDMYEKLGRKYWKTDHTNYQESVNDAFEIHTLLNK